MTSKTSSSAAVNHEVVIVGAGFSGHGFKFGPLTGRILAELVMDGVTTVAPFEAHRARFAASSSAG